MDFDDIILHFLNKQHRNMMYSSVYQISYAEEKLCGFYFDVRLTISYDLYRIETYRNRSLYASKRYEINALNTCDEFRREVTSIYYSLYGI